MNVLNVFSFTLNILAATALLSVGFSFRNFFAFFIAMAVDSDQEKGFVLIRKGA
jgi:hypothetical protein